MHDPLYILMVLCGLYTILYWEGLSRAFRQIRPAPLYRTLSSSPAVSVVIVTRNHLYALKHLLSRLANQDYPNFEIVVVDDDSDDGTPAWLQTFGHNHPGLILQTIQHKKLAPGKKAALTLGIQKTNHPWVLLTDADCVPASNQWIKIMAQQMSEKTDVIIGYSPILPAKGLLNLFERWDYFFVGFQYLAWAAWGRPYMAVGRNLMYRKSLFDKSGGFKNHHDIVSGDDDLFIQQIAHKASIDICLDPKSFMYTQGKPTWTSLIAQKARHVSTSPQYRLADILILSTYPLAQLLFYISAGCLFLSNPVLISTLYFIRVILIMLILYKKAKPLIQNELITHFMLLDIIQPIFYSAVSLMSFFRKKNKW